MKLAIIYTVFDGLELLEASVQNHISLVDHVIIVYQTTSNRGNTFAELGDILNAHYKGSKITLLNWEPDLSKDNKHNEREKHNAGIEQARRLGCTHFILSATDHFYGQYKFKLAKEFIEKEDYDVTLTGMYTYFRYPTWQLTPPEEYYMPFICKIYPETKCIVKRWEHLVDPSVRINTSSKMYLFPMSTFALHHYSLVRRDIRQKFSNAAGSARWGEAVDRYIAEWENYDIEKNPGVEYFQGRKIKLVENYFHLQVDPVRQ